MTNDATLWQLIIAFGNVNLSLSKYCHAIAGKYIASNDKLFGNVKSDIAGDFVATPCPLGYLERLPNMARFFIKYSYTIYMHSYYSASNFRAATI